MNKKNEITKLKGKVRTPLFGKVKIIPPDALKMYFKINEIIDYLNSSPNDPAK